MKRNLLVVDWDFFFPRPPSNSREAFDFYDWGHAESRLFISLVWETRGASFVLRDKPLPRVNDEWKTWWERFDFTEDAMLYFTESNCFAINPVIANDIDGEVWLYDAHHDCGYDKLKTAQALHSGQWSCEEWMVFYGRALGVNNLHARYPRHRPNAFREEPQPYFPSLDRQFYNPNEKTPAFDTVFVCRSGAWVPPWCDEQFIEFIDLAPLDAEEIGGGLVEREFNQERLDAHVRLLRRSEKNTEEST